MKSHTIEIDGKEYQLLEYRNFTIIKKDGNKLGAKATKEIVKKLK